MDPDTAPRQRFAAGIRCGRVRSLSFLLTYRDPNGSLGTALERILPPGYNVAAVKGNVSAVVQSRI